jgi:hypothetical protein
LISFSSTARTAEIINRTTPGCSVRVISHG